MTQQPQSLIQPSQQSAVPTQKEHVVVAGETVEQIAKNYGVPAKYVRQLNKLSGPVRPSQKLRIPMARAAAASGPRQATAPVPAISAKTTPASVTPTPTGTTPGATK